VPPAVVIQDPILDKPVLPEGVAAADQTIITPPAVSSDPNGSTESDTAETTGGSPKTEPGPPGGYPWALLIDAGSTGSRMHLYEWSPRVFHSLPPPVSKPFTSEK